MPDKKEKDVYDLFRWFINTVFDQLWRLARWARGKIVEYGRRKGWW